MNKLSYFFNTTSVWVLIGCFLFGMVIGGVYFWHLWRSIRNFGKGNEKSVKKLFLTSVVRMLIFVGGLLIVSAKNPVRLMTYVVGFMLVRTICFFFYKKRLNREIKNA